MLMIAVLTHRYRVQEEHFGTIRQQIWAFLHFPLHLALVLAVEGVAQSLAWNAAIVKVDMVYNESLSYNLYDPDSFNITDSAYELTDDEWAEIAAKTNETATEVLYNTMANSENIDETLETEVNLSNAWDGTLAIANGTQDVQAAVNAMYWIYYVCQNSIYTLGGFAPPESVSSSNDTESDTIDWDNIDVDALDEASNKQFYVFVLTFVYLFVAMGLVVIFCTVLAALSKKEKTAVHWIRLGASGLVGVALCLLAVMATNSSSYSG
jgi:hypothetical protein